MNKRLVWASLVAVMLMLCAPAVLGQASAGNPALYVERLGAGGRSAEVLFVADDGTLSAVPVPGGLYPAGYPDSIRLGDLALSADGTKLAAVFHERASDAALQVVIADLTLNSCCVALISPLEQVYAYDLAGFSPDGTQIALSFAGAAGSGDFPFTGGMMIVDTASGAPVEITGMEAPMAALSGTGSAVWAQMGGWTENGIQWTPSCYACEPPLEGEYSLWAPQKGSFIARSGAGFSLWADTLAGTGESLYASQVAGYFVSPEPEGMFAIPNVIQFLPGGVLPNGTTASGAPVVFFEPSALDLGGGAHWVSNGSAFLVTPDGGPRWFLRDRSGAQQPIPAPPGARFLMGTTEGWLAAVPNGGNVELVRYVVSPAGAFGSVIDRTQPRSDNFAAYHVLVAPPLGEGIAPVVPPFVPPPSAEVTLLLPPPVVVTTIGPAAMQCPGFLPSRLMPGQLARVTPGDPNNLRALPSVSGALVGRVPGGAEFMVLQGPVCDAAGLAWWQVNYNGLIGWTVEGQGASYFLEPMAAG